MVATPMRAGKQRMVESAESEPRCPAGRALGCLSGRHRLPPAARRTHRMLKDWLSFSLLSLSAIFFVVDPMGVIPLFIAMTRNDSPEKRRGMARRASIAAFFILTTFAVAGTLIFK